MANYNYIDDVPSIDDLIDVDNLADEGETPMGKMQILGNQIKDLSIVGSQILVETDSGTNDLQSELDDIRDVISTTLSPMNFKGVLDASSLGTQLDDAMLGDFYYVSVAGTILTTVELQVGDMIVVNKDVVGTPVAADIDKIDNTEAPDIIRQSHMDGSTVEYADSKVRVKDLGITAAKLASDAVETAKIKDLNVTTGKLANDAVDKTKINADVAGNGLGQNVDGSLEVLVDGTSIEISGDSNEQLQIKDSGVTTAKINADAVDKTKINADVAGNGLGQNVDGSLEVKVDDSGIEINEDTLRLKDSGVTTAKINNDAVDKTKINADVAGNGLGQNVDGSLEVLVDGTTIEISGDSNEQLQIKAGGVDTTQLANDAVDKTKIDADVAGAGLAQAVDGSLKINFAKESFTVPSDAYSDPFELAASPITGSEDVYLNGLLQESGTGKDYVITDDSIQFQYNLKAGEIVRVNYLK